jgi:hypothetical protein
MKIFPVTLIPPMAQKKGKFAAMVAKSIDIGTSALLPYEPASRKLLIEWAPYHLHVLLWNNSTASIEAIESFGGSIADEVDWEQVLGQSSLLPLTNVETWLVCAGPRMLPVPEHLFDAQRSKEELNLLLGAAGWHEPMADLIPQKDMVLAWQMPAAVIGWLQRHFEVLTPRHVAGELLKKPVMDEKTMGQIVLAEKQALLLLYHQEQLLFVGMLPVVNGDDLAYRLLNICAQHHLPAAEVVWQVSGMIEKEAPLYTGLSKYLEQIDLWPVPFELSDGVSPQYFAHLYTLLA